ncbi:MAG: PAS domain S-box protein [Desulfobacteraceae bacterium]|nr:PAS domain S-box protein [Desulfobacteraceae bacterium]
MNLDNSARLMEILNAMEDGIYIIRQDYTVEFMNEAMTGIFGDGRGKKCYEVINHSTEMCPWCKADDIFKNGDTVHSEIYIPQVQRSYRLIEVPIRNIDGTISKLNIYRDITNRKDTEAKLKATEEDYRRLFENVSVGVYVSSKKGRMINANKALLDMLGYSRIDDFLSLDIQKDMYLNPEDRSNFQALIEKNGRVVDYEVDFKNKNGDRVPVLLNSHVRYDSAGNILGYEGICVDQSHRKKMEQQIKEAHDFLNNIIQTSPNSIIGTDMNGDVIIWNQGAEETMGYRADEILGRMNVENLYPEGMARKMMKKIRSDEYGGRGKLRAYPMTFRKKNGESVEGSISANIICNDKKEEIASVGIFVDLEERLEMERKLGHTQEQLLQSEKLAAMGRLTSQIAHELNNPLYGIMNTLELMKTEISPTNKRRRLLDMALSETVRLTDMLRKMLSFSKPDQEERKPFDINTIIDEILLLHEKQLRENDIKIHAQLTPDLGPVYASKNQLRQVFLNMVSNARDAMPEGGTLSVTTDLAAKKIRITISDDGTGIKPEHVDKVFEAFFTTKTDSVKGVGLGLSVCYGFIQDHGGDIHVESEWGTGTTFFITLPVYTGPEEISPFS